MFSRILVKLIDQAIVPAVMLLAVKIISTVLVSKYMGFDFGFGPAGFTYSKPDDYLLVNTYSTFAMVVVLSVGLFYILLKSLIFHETHISPKLTAKLFTLKLSTFMQSTYDLYSQGAVWISYSYLLLMVSAIMALFGLIQTWVFYASLVLTVVTTVLFVMDVENEMSISAHKKGASDDEEVILTFEEETQ